MFRKRTFRENVRQLFLRVDVPDGNGWIREDAFEKPIQVEVVMVEEEVDVVRLYLLRGISIVT